jgi:hypothetical protein
MSAGHRIQAFATHQPQLSALEPTTTRATRTTPPRIRVIREIRGSALRSDRRFRLTPESPRPPLGPAPSTDTPAT